MRSRLPRRRATGLLAATGAAVIALTGCGVSNAGAAAVVGGERIMNRELRTEVDAYEAQAAEAGREVPPDQRSRLTSDVLSNLIAMTALRGLAEEEGIDLGRHALDAKLEELGGREAMAGQGIPESQIDDQARLALLGEELLDRADSDETAELEEQLRAGARRQLEQQAQDMGLRGEELRSQVDEALRQQEGALQRELTNVYLNDRLTEYVAETDITVNPRYGTFESESLRITPEESPLSAPEKQAAPQLGLGE